MNGITVYNMTKVVNLAQEKYDVYIGRAGKGQDGYFGNPHPVGFCRICKCIHDRAEALKEYGDYFYQRIRSDKDFLNKIMDLQGKVLGCFCKPKDCHGDIIVDFLEKNEY